MPLEKGSSKEVIGRNIAKLREEGRPEKQAVAIAFKTAGKARDAITSAGQEQQARNAFATSQEYALRGAMTKPPISLNSAKPGVAIGNFRGGVDKL